MTAFDTDVMTLILFGDPAYLVRLNGVAPADRFVPVVAVAEVVRGWLNAIRRAEAGKGRVSLGRAYEKFEKGMRDLAAFPTLSYSPAAEAQYSALKAAEVRIGTQDLRIAAICIAHGAKLVTRNARDFSQIPGLNLEIWN